MSGEKIKAMTESKENWTALQSEAKDEEKKFSIRVERIR